MLKPEQAISIFKHFLEDALKNEGWYKAVNHYVKATILYGSVAKGTNREDSDIDILMILPIEIEEKFTKGEYIYSYHIYEINIVLRSIEKLRLLAQEQKDMFQKEVFRKSIIISAKNGEVKTLLKKIQKI
jgi:predicted nucleotidyltransferase